MSERTRDMGASADADRATRPADQAQGLGDTASVPCAVLDNIHGEAVAGYGRKCRVCGGTAALEQLNRYWHYESGPDGEYVVWLPGRYCSRTCLAASPIIDWKRVASAIEARSGETTQIGSTAGESAVPKADAQQSGQHPSDRPNGDER